MFKFNSSFYYRYEKNSSVNSGHFYAHDLLCRMHQPACYTTSYPAPVATQLPAVSQPIATQSPIAGVWDLSSYNNGKGAIQSVISGSQTTANFQADWKLSGSGGCNQYNAEYTTTASNGITITQPITTLMACAEPVMQQETQYLSLLPTAAKYEISGDQLTLFDSTGVKILIYKNRQLFPLREPGTCSIITMAREQFSQ